MYKEELMKKLLFSDTDGLIPKYDIYCCNPFGRMKGFLHQKTVVVVLETSYRDITSSMFGSLSTGLVLQSGFSLNSYTAYSLQAQAQYMQYMAAALKIHTHTNIWRWWLLVTPLRG